MTALKIEPFHLGDYEEYLADKKYMMDKDNVNELKRMLGIISPSYNIVKHTFCERMSPVDCMRDDSRYRQEVLLDWNTGKEE